MLPLLTERRVGKIQSGPFAPVRQSFPFPFWHEGDIQRAKWRSRESGERARRAANLAMAICLKKGVDEKQIRWGEGGMMEAAAAALHTLAIGNGGRTE